jgi:NADH dehydrogenase
VAEIKFLPKLTGFPAWVIWVGLHIVTLLGNRNRFATLVNLSAKYLSVGSHNAIVGETPYVMADKPFVVDARQAPRAVSARQARKNAESLASQGVEGIRQGAGTDHDA